MYSHIPAILLGFCFLVSGGLKGIDPYSTSLKLGEYFRVWGWDGFVADHALACSVCLCAGELCMRCDGRLLWHYAACLLVGLAVIVRGVPQGKEEAAMKAWGMAYKVACRPNTAGCLFRAGKMQKKAYFFGLTKRVY